MQDRLRLRQRPIIESVERYTLKPLQPYTVGTMIQDQGSRRLLPPCGSVRMHADEACRSYRAQFQSDFPFMRSNSGAMTRIGPTFSACAWPGSGRAGHDHAANVCATYDLSCAENKTSGCPHGNVHNVHKQPIGKEARGDCRAREARGQGTRDGRPACPSICVVVAPETSGSPSTVTLVFSGGMTRLSLSQRAIAPCAAAWTRLGDFDASIDEQDLGEYKRVGRGARWHARWGACRLPRATR